jgi:hypothetical protein
MERNFENTRNESYDLAVQLQNSVQGLFSELMAFLPELVAALVIIILGFLIGGILGTAVRKLFKRTKLDKALDKAGVDELTNRAGYAFKPARFAGELVKWFIILAFTIVALNVLGLTAVTEFMGEVLAYLPKVLAAALILFVGLIAANAARGITEGAIRSAKTISSDKAGMLGNVAYYAVVIFAALAALNQMEIAPELIQILFAGIVVAVSLAFGLAFGLGGRTTAARYLESMSGAAEKETQSRPHNHQQHKQ